MVGTRKSIIPMSCADDNTIGISFTTGFRLLDHLMFSRNMLELSSFFPQVHAPLHMMHDTEIGFDNLNIMSSL